MKKGDISVCQHSMVSYDMPRCFTKLLPKAVKRKHIFYQEGFGTILGFFFFFNKKMLKSFDKTAATMAFTIAL